MAAVVAPLLPKKVAPVITEKKLHWNSYDKLKINLLRTSVPSIVSHWYMKDLKVLTNEKRGGVTLVSFDRSPFKLFSLKFLNKSVRGLKLLSEPCFSYLQTIIVFK